MRIGFVGTGSITQAVVTGLCNSDFGATKIALSPRNAEIAEALARLDDRVRVCASNQEVVDASDVVCIAVLPNVAQDVLKALAFRSGQTVISFVAGVTMPMLASCIADGVTRVRAIPLPATALGCGSTAIHPANVEAKRIFSAIGAAVEVDDETQFDAFLAATATMSTFYSMVDAQTQWLANKGVSYDNARTFMAGHYAGLMKLAMSGGESFAELAQHCTTQGGINELMQKTLDEQGVFDKFGTALDVVWKRLETK
jgi:pyrroline-5-carboxylate reductase